MRYELKCNKCGVTIGYMSMNIGNSNIRIVKNIKDSEGVHPICCPSCEEKENESDNKR